MKKRHLLAILPALLLSSCGKESITGVYKFMLGREGDGQTQIGVSIELKDDDFSYDKYCNIKDYVADHAALLAYDKSKLDDGDIIRVQEDTDGKIHFYKFVEASNDFTDLGTDRPKTRSTLPNAKLFKANLSMGTAVYKLPEKLSEAVSKGITGYYRATEFYDESEKEYGQRYVLGTVISEEHIQGLPLIYSYLDDIGYGEFSKLMKAFIDGLSLSADPEFFSGLLSYALTTYNNGKNLTIKIPVSLGDFQQQLVWYGEYIDFDEEVKQKIYTVENISENFADILTTMKFYDLAKHVDLQGNPVTIPGKPIGDSRLGTQPSKVIGEDGMNDVAKINRLFAKEFSNTYTYIDKSGSKVKEATLTRWPTIINNKITYTYYYHGSEASGKASLDKWVMAENEYGAFDKETEVRISFNTAIVDKDLGYQIASFSNPADGKIIDPETFYRDEFEFRSFHDLPLSLTKSKE